MNTLQGHDLNQLHDLVENYGWRTVLNALNDIIQKKEVDTARLSPCGWCSEPNKPAVYFCRHHPNGVRY